MEKEQLTLNSAVICGVGRKRKNNQDNYYLNGSYRWDPNSLEVFREENTAEGSALYAVADGMGGEKDGEIASWLAVRSLDELNHVPTLDEMLHYLHERNLELCKMMEDNGGQYSGTTFVGVSIHGDTVDMVNIGDSRAYLLRNGRMTRISEDHTVVQELVDAGTISPSEADTHPDRHKLTQNLGIFPEEMDIEPYLLTGQVREGDVFLLCSDGLFDVAGEKNMEKILLAEGTPRQKADDLFNAAMEAGGRDNITVMLISVE